jgi:hypothetical protein
VWYAGISENHLARVFQLVTNKQVVCDLGTANYRVPIVNQDLKTLQFMFRIGLPMFGILMIAIMCYGAGWPS